jgi:hypothetical protein
VVAHACDASVESRISSANLFMFISRAPYALALINMKPAHLTTILMSSRSQALLVGGTGKEQVLKSVPDPDWTRKLAEILLDPVEKLLAEACLDHNRRIPN